MVLTVHISSICEDAIFIAPQNPSPWNYIRGSVVKIVSFKQGEARILTRVLEH